MSDKTDTITTASVVTSDESPEICQHRSRFENTHDEKLLAAPFSEAVALEKGPPVFPAAVHAANGRAMLLLSNPSPLTTYIQLELSVSRLNTVHQHLWLAGLPRPARSLHRQELIGRTIVVTEQTDLHLCWYKSRFFIKPLPAFLLHHDSWDALARNKGLHREACGLLVSYTWLVSRESDLKRALEIGLLPKHVTWEDWTTFVTDFLQHVDVRDGDAINQRYQYGELRLARLNTIFRVLGARNLSPRAVRMGYMTEPDWYTRFLRENFGWLVVVFGYIAIVLNAMQVGLNTSQLAQNKMYHAVAYGFSTFAIAMPVAMFACIFVVSIVIVWYNVSGTLRYVKGFERARTADRWDRAEGLEGNGERR